MVVFWSPEDLIRPSCFTIHTQMLRPVGLTLTGEEAGREKTVIKYQVWSQVINTEISCSKARSRSGENSQLGLTHIIALGLEVSISKNSLI